MIHAEACALPPCAECGGPTAYRVVAGLLCCASNLCDWIAHVEPEGTAEPLRARTLAEALLRARAEGRL